MTHHEGHEHDEEREVGHEAANPTQERIDAAPESDRPVDVDTPA